MNANKIVKYIEEDNFGNYSQELKLRNKYSKLEMKFMQEDQINFLLSQQIRDIDVESD
jgi:hypothetical protein